MRRALLAVCLAGALAGPAEAATVQVRTVTEGGGKGPEVSYRELVVAGGGGEANDIVLAPEGDDVVVTDRGAPLTARDGCTALPDGRVSCAGPLSTGLITLGDANDAFESSPAFSRLVVNLGDGDDRTLVTVAHATVAGGPGDDSIVTGGGNDALDGGAGADILSGGEGRDEVSYADRTAPVIVDLARETGNGETGEDDTLRGIEEVEGGKGDDDLRGDAGRNVLQGGDGEDSVDGRDGNDTLEGAKRVIGGAGNDLIRFTELRPNVDCGAGRDTVDHPEGGSILSPDCERVNLAIGSSLFMRLGLPLAGLDARFASLRALCAIDGSRPCTGLVEVATKRGTLLAVGRGTARPGRTLRVETTLTPAGRRLLRRTRSVDVRVRAVVVEPGDRFNRRTVYRDGFFTKLRRR